MQLEKKKIIIFHSDVSADASPDEMDVLDEANFIAKGLTDLGFKIQVLPFKLNLPDFIRQIEEIKPDAVFNLVESIETDGRLIHIAPSLFDHLKIPYFGCSSDAIMLTSNKLFTKKVLEGSGIPTPKYICLSNIKQVEIGSNELFIFKSVWEHASIGMDENSIRPIPDRKEIYEFLKNCKDQGRQSFAEAFIEGREFNVSMFGGYLNPEILPVAEIKFIDFPEGKPKIVDYKAKWMEDSFEYKNTVRSYDFNEADKPLYDKLREISLRCWEVFELNGYARVDFRVDKDNNPYVLEINANPCISPDGGFIAATERMGYKFTDVLLKIMTETNNKK